MVETSVLLAGAVNWCWSSGFDRRMACFGISLRRIATLLDTRTRRSERNGRAHSEPAIHRFWQNGESLTILEELDLPGGALDGLDVPEKGFVIRGGREMEEHFECL